MNLYISGSNTKGNCYQLLNDLKEDEDSFIALADKEIQYCLGCNQCLKGLEDICVLKDDMQEIYKEILKADKIIIATPIYMNHITGILKNVIDRWNPFGAKDTYLKGKKIYLLTIGQISEEENENIVKEIKRYFEGISEFMGFEFRFLRNLSSGNILEVDDIRKNYKNYEDIIKNLKRKIME